VLEGNIGELHHSDAEKDKIRIKHNWNRSDTGTPMIE
jgi:hypothetical protein